MVALHSYPHPYLKDRRRGDRRWRSYCTWMRRLKNDWATHGRQYDLVPLYNWGSGKPVRVIGWRTTLCDCFNLKHRQAWRFKDTPTLDCSQAAARRSDGWHDHDLWETRHDEVVREQHGKSRFRRLKRLKRQVEPALFRMCCCTCGYFIRFEPAWSSRWGVRCDGCKKRLGDLNIMNARVG